MESSRRPEGLVDMSSTEVWNSDPTPRALFLLGSIQNLWVTWLLSLNPSNQAHWEGLVVSPITLSGHGSCPPGLGHQLWMTFSKVPPEAVIYLTISIMFTCDTVMIKRAMAVRFSNLVPVDKRKKCNRKKPTYMLSSYNCLLLFSFIS